MRVNNIIEKKKAGGADDAPYGMLRWALILFLVVEYVRPQAIANLKLQFIIIILLLVSYVATKNHPRSNIMLAMLVFFAVILKSLPFASNNYSVYTVLQVMFGHFTIAYALSWLMSWRSAFKQIVWAWVFILFYVSIYGVLHAGRGPGGMIGDENDLALAIVTILPFALFGFDYHKGAKKWLFAFIALVFVAGVIASFSRGGFLGLAVGTLYYFILSKDKMKKVFILLFAVLAFITFAPSEYLDEITSISKDSKKDEANADSTGLQRYYLWATAYEMFKQNPIMGVGAGNFSFSAGAYQPTTGSWPEQYLLRSWSGTTAHSVYFLMIAELGAPGTIVYIYILWHFFKLVKRIAKRVKEEPDIDEQFRSDVLFYSSALIAGMMSSLVSGIFLSALYYPHVWYLCGIAVALNTMVNRELGDAEVVDEKNAKSKPKLKPKAKPEHLTSFS